MRPIPTGSPSPFRELRVRGGAGALLGVLALAACSSKTARGPQGASDTPRPTTPAHVATQETTTHAPSDVSTLVVMLHPVQSGDTPAELLVTSPDGKRTGIDSGTFALVTQVPNAYYDSAPPPAQTDEDEPPASLMRRVTVPIPIAGRWTAAVVARRTGPYVLEVALTMPNGSARATKADTARVRSSEVQRYEIMYDPAAANPLVVRPLRALRGG